MGFPDRIERVMEIAHPPAKVWAALTTAEGLASWFGDQAAIDLRPGGSAQVRWTGGHQTTELEGGHHHEDTPDRFAGRVGGCAPAAAREGEGVDPRP